VTQTNIIKAHVENYENHDRLHMLSIEDPLTGLSNRRAMEIDIKPAAALSKHQTQPYSIALIDIDYFKKYNDGYHHKAGDEALIFLAKKLRKNVRNSDKIFRYDGEEFLFLKPMTSAQGAKITTHRICDTIAQEKYPLEPSDLWFLPISIGYAASFLENWEMVVEQADLALYDAKADGRPQICSAEEPGESEFWDLSRKLDEGQPFVNYPLR
jgi:diguanylate cyclase (GGDEF)-like protein